MNGESFGERLKRLREAAGLSQPDLAERAGMNRFGVAKLEQGQRQPSWETVQALAKALGVNCLAFTGDAEGLPTAEDAEASRPKSGRPRKPPAAAVPEPPPPAAKGEPKKPRKRKGGGK